MASALPETVGIWQLGSRLHASDDFSVVRAQPVDAAGSPRWDYVAKIGTSDEGRLGIARSIAAGSAISNPNVVPILDGDPLEASPFVVMPMLEGQTMHWHLQRGGRKPLPVALWLVRQICQSLQSFHIAGWTHGDVKPANLMVGENGHVTLIDLAFARKGIAEQTSPFRGTSEYAAPELLANASAVSPASDVFAAGRILWEWLSSVDTSNDSLLSPVCEWVERMVDESPLSRPTAEEVGRGLLRLEIDTLGDHIVPAATRRAA